jgi:hypothetical protein
VHAVRRLQRWSVALAARIGGGGLSEMIEGGGTAAEQAVCFTAIPYH